MSLLPFLLALARSKTPQTVSFTPGPRSFTVPAGVNRIESMTGRGGPSFTSGQTSSGYSTTFRRTTTRGNNPPVITTGDLGKTYNQPTPSNYCSLDSGWDGTAYYDIETCYYYTPFSGNEPIINNGSDLVAFGKTFPGRPAPAGSPGAASSITYTSVVVVPGATYNFNVPQSNGTAGNEGKLSITFYS